MNDIPRFNQLQWSLFLTGILLLLLFLAWPFLGIIALGLLSAWVFYPLYARFLKVIKSAGFSVVLTIILAFCIVAIPVTVVIALSAVQMTQLATDLAATYIATGSSFEQTIHSITNSFNDIAQPVLGSEAVDAAAIADFVRNTIPGVLKGAAGFVVDTVSNIPLAIILTILYVTIFAESLFYGKRIVDAVRKMSPLGQKATHTYLARVGLMANAMVKGQLLIAFIIAVLSSFLLTLLGLGDYFFLMVVVFTLLNLVPLGSGILIMPIIIIAILAGNVLPGLLILLLYIGVSNLDIVLRPRLIPRSIQLSAGLTMIAVFGGIAWFGLLGVVYGPILMIILVTSVQMYQEYSRRRK